MVREMEAILMTEPDRPPVAASTAESLGLRLLHMIIFAVVFWVLCWAVAITALAQLGFRVFAAAPSPDLRRFGSGLGRYAGQVIAYLSFASDVLPFPFSDWPDAPTRVTEDDLSGL
jgi:hypothetical protein